MPPVISWRRLRSQSSSLILMLHKPAVESGVKSVRLDYGEIAETAKKGYEITVFCDLQGGIHKRAGNGALIYAGSVRHKFNLWIPEVDSPSSQKILNLIENRYAGRGRGYVYVSGRASLYPPNEYGKPKIVLTSAGQLSDFPPGT